MCSDDYVDQYKDIMKARLKEIILLTLAPSQTNCLLNPSDPSLRSLFAWYFVCVSDNALYFLC